MISRRNTLEVLTMILGGTLSPQLTAVVMGQVLNTGASVAVTDAQKTLIAELADVIIPVTDDTPGAKAAGVEEFIVRLLRDCHVLKDQEAFYAGLARIDAASEKAHGKTFVELEPDEKIAIVQDAIKTNAGFFRQMRRFTITGYFISEIGATQALEYLPVPGRFEGDVPIRPGQKAWAISQ